MRHAARALLQRIDEEMHNTARWTGRAALSSAVRSALESVPREAFVPAEHRASAYDNRPLPIGHGQTISQPYIVALMIELLDPEPDDVALEIGTGCGYAAAVLSQVVSRVHTIDIVADLAAAARERLARLGYANVTVHEGDGYAGWPDAAPYDGIVVTAAAPEIPPALIDQLTPGGRLVLPIGAAFDAQELIVVTKDEAGAVTSRRVLPVAFVPMVPGH